MRIKKLKTMKNNCLKLSQLHIMNLKKIYFGTFKFIFPSSAIDCKTKYLVEVVKKTKTLETEIIVTLLILFIFLEINVKTFEDDYLI